MFPTQAKLELFAREKHENWDSLGNEIDGYDLRTILPIDEEKHKIVYFQ